MRSALLMVLPLMVACSAKHAEFGVDPDAATDDSGNPIQADGGSLDPNKDGSVTDPDGGTTVMTTIYAHTDDTLYTVDPMSMAVTMIGPMQGVSGGTGDKAVTDLAVDTSGAVWVNTESVIYKAAVPKAPGPVQLTKVANIAIGQGQKFYALAFVPAGVLGQSETLIGGDNCGELYAIDANGSTKDLGNFGKDSSRTSAIFALSGDLVFYMDASNKPVGLATIRSCTKPNNSTCTTSCVTSSDYLAGVDMNALVAAYKSGTPGALNAGIYGGSKSGPGAGTGYGDLFGLGAWQGTVFAFERRVGQGTPRLLTLSTQSGVGTVVSSSFNFTNGWSGAGVTTSVKVNVPPPPPPPN